MTTMTPHVVILHDDAEPGTERSDVIAVERYLSDAGFQVTPLCLDGVLCEPETVLTGLRRLQPDAVFNLYEGSIDRPEGEALVAGLLEWLSLPFTGSPSFALRLALNKPLAKRLLLGAGIPTPDFFVVHQLPVPTCPLDWPVIVKPGAEDGSIGIDQGSVVTDRQSLTKRVAHLLERYGPPVLIEEFLDGRELKVGLIELPELRPLPIGEIQHLEREPGFWPLVTHEGKWAPESRDYLATPPCFPEDLSPKLIRRLQRLALSAFRLFGCRDYASIDFRLNSAGKPYVLEVNPNPHFNPADEFAQTLRVAGLTHRKFTVELVKAALRRGGKALPVPVAPKLRRKRVRASVPHRQRV
jgi:D-alanine-D-alanine ligase